MSRGWGGVGVSIIRILKGLFGQYWKINATPNQLTSSYRMLGLKQLKLGARTIRIYVTEVQIIEPVLLLYLKNKNNACLPVFKKSLLTKRKLEKAKNSIFKMFEIWNWSIRTDSWGATSKILNFLWQYSLLLSSKGHNLSDCR